MWYLVGLWLLFSISHSGLDLSRDLTREKRLGISVRDSVRYYAIQAVLLFVVFFPINYAILWILGVF